jgi:hypothetical protein
MIMTKNVFFTSLTIILSCLTTKEGYAANFNTATASSPARIVIQNAVISTSSGNKYASIRLVAKDNKNLHEGQVYQAHFGSRANSGDGEDASYNEADEIIYVPALLQAGSLSHQTTLKQINRELSEFVIIEVRTSVVRPPEDLFFNPSSVHKVNKDNY